MGDENPIRTLKITPNLDMEKATRNTMSSYRENNVVPLRLTPSVGAKGPAKLATIILMFHTQGESLSEAWTRFKDLLQKVPCHSIDLWLQVQIFYDHVTPVIRGTLTIGLVASFADRMAKNPPGGIIRGTSTYMTTNVGTTQGIFAKPVMEISLPQMSRSHPTRPALYRALENQVPMLDGSSFAFFFCLMQPTQVNQNHYLISRFV
ncbi:hypothetical protein Tco_1003880 [Tanacetum coccineum]|uniref:Uncharacterized protein n=1 Tax=Tanacetum coccineum TaxID=301880 RepID=A0ABQ5FAT8_9ASTR